MAYDPLSKVVETTIAQPLYMGRANGASSIVKEKLYYMGGLDDQSRSLNHVYVFDPEINKWSEWTSCLHLEAR